MSECVCVCVCFLCVCVCLCMHTYVIVSLSGLAWVEGLVKAVGPPGHSGP